MGNRIIYKLLNFAISYTIGMLFMNEAYHLVSILETSKLLFNREEQFGFGEKFKLI